MIRASKILQITGLLLVAVSAMSPTFAEEEDTRELALQQRLEWAWNQAQGRAYPLQLGREFRLSPGDVVELQFIYNPELNQNVQIRPDGQISMPFIGEVELAGKTVNEATQELANQYETILTTPEIVIRVAQFAAQKVYVGGEVLRPGPVAMPGTLTLLDAIMESGGLKHSAKRSTIVLIRRSETGQAMLSKVSLENRGKEASEASTLRLQPFDVILVPEKKIAKVNRWVDEYIRQMIPVDLTAGFTYLANSSFVP